MWQSLSNAMDPATRSVGAALLCGVLTERVSSRHSACELCSDMLSWVMLPILFKIVRRPYADKLSRATPSTLSLWIVASSIVTFCIFKTENGLVAYFPALTPLLLAAQEYLGSEAHTPAKSHSWFSPIVTTFWGTTLAASFAIVTLSGWDLRRYALSIIPVTALLVAYIVFTPRTDKSSQYFPSFNTEDAILPLSLRIAVMLVILLGTETIAFGLPRSQTIIPTLTLSLAKALSWYFTIQTIQHSTWLLPTAMGTFSLMSTRNPFKQTSDAQALSHVIASLITLAQVIYMLPKWAKARSALWILSLVPLAPYVANILAIEVAQSLSSSHSRGHPVEILIHNAKETFETMLQKQSKNYTTAHDEYRRRYGIEPPPGFEAWYEFATSHQSPIIDDFDLIYNGISPFLRLSGQEVREIMSEVYNAPDSEVWLCTFSGRKAETYCSHPYRTFDRHNELMFNKLLGDLPGILPDMNFLVNHLDEPRVLIPTRSQGAGSQSNERFNISDISRRPIWDKLTEFCASRESRSVRTSYTATTLALPFVTDPLSAMDLCHHPEYSAMYGLAMSPTSLLLIKGLVPVFSTGSPSTMGDILYPSPAYFESEFQYSDANDVKWEKKHNNLYWTGSTTGGFALDDQWRHYHRQRFVTLAQNLQKHHHSYLRETDGVISRVKSSFLNRRLYDVAFTRIFQCKRKHCRDQRAYFDVRSWAHKDEALRSRLVFDLDGNGISGRYYKLLASRSAPLKQTLLREWHDERLVPWVHYIPVSQSMEELPELVSYLTSSESGQRRAQEIAEQGRKWFFKAFRDVDMAIYTYRLLLELARLQDPKRPASP